jgi:OOP family OmpA-OmpF porin
MKESDKLITLEEDTLLMIRKSFFIALLIVSGLITQDLLSQQNIESRIKAIDNEISRLRQEQYDLISPTNFEKAEQELKNARKDFQEGQDIRGIMGKLDKAARYLKLVEDVGKQGKILFKDVLEARDDALTVRAPEFAPKEFEESEMLFREASKRLEKGNLNDARAASVKTVNAYRKAELTAIKESIVGNVRDLLKQADEQDVEDYAPITLHEAQNSYQQVLEILNSNRYAKTNAADIAKLAEYQVKHAMYLAKVLKELKKDDNNWERVIRNMEDRLDHISVELGFSGHYENGLAETEKEIILAIRNLKEENKTLKEDLKTQQTENEDLRNKIQKYEKTVVTELQQKKEWEEKLKKIEKIFTRDEAQVLLSEDQMIIRLYGLTFRSGTAVIMPEHFMLLTKVMRALREFPNKKIIIAGHTDSQGNDSYNLNLSENRAAAVRAYLEANMGLPPDQLESIGYGESQPIASNETADGRRLNRRIEIIVDLTSGAK